jgi:hypothetical protein
MEQLTIEVRTTHSSMAENILHDNGILEVKIKEGAEIDAAQVHSNIEAIKEITDDRHPVLVDARVIFTITQEARELAAENSKNRLAKAVLINSLATRLIGNFYINFHKPSIPTKIFTSREDAIEWLTKFL